MPLHRPDSIHAPMNLDRGQRERQDLSLLGYPQSRVVFCHGRVEAGIARDVGQDNDNFDEHSQKYSDVYLNVACACYSAFGALLLLLEAKSYSLRKRSSRPMNAGIFLFPSSSSSLTLAYLTFALFPSFELVLRLLRCPVRFSVSPLKQSHAWTFLIVVRLA